MKNKKELIEKYIELLFYYNETTNLFSRKLKEKDIRILIKETLFMESHIKGKLIIDAGSGNGILGIPIAINNPSKKIYLVETKNKKTNILRLIKKQLTLENVIVFEGGIKNFFDKVFKKRNDFTTLIARGFPRNEELFKFLKKKLIKQLLLITIEDKINLIQLHTKNTDVRVYDVESKDKLKIIKLENVSRGTKEEQDNICC